MPRHCRLATRHFNHAGITGNCQSCHNGSAAQARVAITSPPTRTARVPYLRGVVTGHFSHAGITGNCQNCHNGSAAQGQEWQSHSHHPGLCRLSFHGGLAPRQFQPCRHHQ